MRLPHQPKDAYLNRTFRPVFASRLPSKLALARLGSIRCLATLQLLMCRHRCLLLDGYFLPLASSFSAIFPLAFARASV